MRIAVFAVGALRGPEAEIAGRYLTRLRPLLPAEVREFRTLRALRAALERHAGPRIVLDERGRTFDSAGFARFVTDLVDGPGTPVFCLAGAEGFDDADRRAAATVLSLSPLTLPHRLARVVLLEQLYRAATLRAGHPYHRDG